MNDIENQVLSLFRMQSRTSAYLVSLGLPLNVGAIRHVIQAVGNIVQGCEIV